MCLGGFVPCGIGPNHCRLRHTGWEKCGHGFTSRLRVTSSVHCLDKLMVFLSTLQSLVRRFWQVS